MKAIKNMYKYIWQEFYLDRLFIRIKIKIFNNHLMYDELKQYYIHCIIKNRGILNLRGFYEIKRYKRFKKIF